MFSTIHYQIFLLLWFPSILKPFLLHSTTVMSCLQESVSEVSEESLEHREPTGIELVPPLVLLEREEAHELVDVFFPNEEIKNLFFRFVQLWRAPSQIRLIVFRVNLKLKLDFNLWIVFISCDEFLNWWFKKSYSSTNFLSPVFFMFFINLRTSIYEF